MISINISIPLSVSMCPELALLRRHSTQVLTYLYETVDGWYLEGLSIVSHADPVPRPHIPTTSWRAHIYLSDRPATGLCCCDTSSLLHPRPLRSGCQASDLTTRSCGKPPGFLHPGTDLSGLPYVPLVFGSLSHPSLSFFRSTAQRPDSISRHNLVPSRR